MKHWNNESYLHVHGDNDYDYAPLDADTTPAPAPVLPASLWMTDDGEILAPEQLAARGFKEDGAGPDFLLHASGAYAERITKIRVHVSACDGNFKKVFTSPAKAAAYCESMGFRNDGGVCEGGYSRFDGVTCVR